MHNKSLSRTCKYWIFIKWIVEFGLSLNFQESFLESVWLHRMTNTWIRSTPRFTQVSKTCVKEFGKVFDNERTLPNNTMLQHPTLSSRDKDLFLEYTLTLIVYKFLCCCFSLARLAWLFHAGNFQFIIAKWEVSELSYIHMALCYCMFAVQHVRSLLLLIALNYNLESEKGMFA